MTFEVKAQRYRWVILSIVFLVFAASYLPRLVYPPLIPEMRVALDLTYTEAGMLMSGFWAGYVVMQFPSGFLSDRIGVKRVIVTAIMLVGLFGFLTGATSNFFECLIFRFTTGVAAGCIFAPSSSAILRWFPSHERSLAISIFMAASSVGSTVALASSAVVSSIFGEWKWSFFILSIPAFIAGVFSILLMRENPAIQKTLLGEVKLTSGFTLVFRNWRIWFLSLATFGNLTVYSGTITWAPTYLVKTFGMTEINAGAIASTMAIVGIFATPLGGFLADKIFKKSLVMFIGVLLSGLTCIILALTKTVDPHAAVTLFILIIFFDTFSWIGPSLLPEWYAANVMGAASGLLNLITILGAVVGPLVFGIILDATGSFYISWLILGCLSATLSSLLIPLMRREQKF